MLPPGTRLGSYELSALVGAGGMGDVYRARDTRLDRTVAIKILKTEFSHRFDREARAISALNHPHICSLHDVGQEGETEYLVMEYVQGKPLACPMEVRQAVEFGVQIADALAAAHRQGIIHRDLKPANILVTREGVKLLDFGIASMQPQIAAFEQGVTTSRTIEGALVGTLEYMAPEQLEGRKADERTDIYAFGLVLYEMLTGLRAGEASSAAGVIAAVMSGPVPSVRTRRPEVPEELERLIHRCLEKDPDRRWQSAEALREALRWLLDSRGAQQAPVSDSSVAKRAWRRRWAGAVLFVLAAAACVGAGWLAASLSHRAPADLSMVTDLDLPADLAAGFDSVFAIAPDGTSVVFNAGRALWLRSLQNGTVRRLGGTAGGTLPFWSPSSRALAFFADGQLQRLTLPDGSPVVLASAPSPRGGAWSSRGVIVFAPSLGGPLLQVAEDGGSTSAVTALDSSRQEVTHQFPSFVSGGNRFVFFAGSRVPQLSTVRMAALDSAGSPSPPVSSQPFQNHAVVADTSEGTWLLSVRDGELVAQSFDADTGRVSGPARTLARRVRPQFSVMSSGAIVYIVDPDVRNQPVWVDRDGRTIGPAGEVGSYQDLGLSREQTKAAYVGAAEAGGVQVLSILDLTTGATTRLRIEGVPDDPTWSPDGRQIAISLKVEGVREEDVYITDLARPDQPRRLLATPAARWPLDWSADGKLILYAEIDPRTNYDIWVAAADGSGRPTAVVRGPAKDQGARFSPNGKWVAYQSNESGLSRVYLTDVFGRTGRTTPVSAGEGNRARWRADGREIFYQAPDRNLMVVPIEWSGEVPVPGTPKLLFKSSGRFEPAAMGEKFLVLQDVASPDVARVHVLTGWQRQLPE